jgi:protein MpaA
MRFVAALLSALPIGHSVQGRALAPVVLGAAPAAHRLLVVGCIHGNEGAGLAIARALVRGGAVPGVEIVVLPSLNPDSCSRGTTRGNAHGVDLNRDFPPEGSASEPGTRYFMRLVRAVHPAATVVFHQHQDVVRAWGASRATARRFATLLGGLLPYRAWRWPAGNAAGWQTRTFPGTASFAVELPAGDVPASLVPRYVRALRALARVGFVR